MTREFTSSVFSHTRQRLGRGLGIAAMSAILAMSQFATAASIDDVLAGDHRSEQNKARDQYRKPKETLEFLGLKEDMTVVEIWPGGGWYTEILAPVLKDNGKFIAAQYDLNGPYRYMRGSLAGFLEKMATHHKLYKDVHIIEYAIPYKLKLAEPGSVDMVLTFRNVHNLVMDGYGKGRYADVAFTSMYDALKPGGVLGVVDHRWDDPATEDPISDNGYISVERTVAMAERAGFKLVAESDILSNPKDTKDYKHGVWSLPPTLAIDDELKDKHRQIGESDRFLLKFVKPEAN